MRASLGASALLLTCSLIPIPALAKPVTFPGGQQIMIMNDQDMNAVHYHYSFDAKNAIQSRTDYVRDEDVFVTGAQWDRLIHRWNLPGAQANVYGAVGGGYARSPDEECIALFGNFLADYETRRVFAAYENDFVSADGVTQQLWHRGRIGFAPYEGEYDDLHTWLMLQTDYRPDQEDEVTVTPMVRLFKTNWMVEGGVTHRGEGMINLIFQY